MLFNCPVTEIVLAEALDLSIETVQRYTLENKIPCVELPNGEKRYYLDAVILALTGELPFYRNDLKRKYTYQDYRKLPSEPGLKYEIIEGRLIPRPSPSKTEQSTTADLAKVLHDYFIQLDPRGKIYTAPFDVRLQASTVVQPDILYISGRQLNIIKANRINGAPNLVVEIIAPAIQNRNYFRKLQIYLKASVQHFWIVDPGEKSLHCFALRDNKYSLAAMGKDNDIVQHPDFAGMTISLGALW